jgi:uncharacterized protein involved in outer membrane biogenesis
VSIQKQAVLRWLKWIIGSLLAPVVLAVLFIAVFGWNWLRAPIERVTLEKTGRVLLISGDIEVELAWPLPRIRTGAVSFANPAWAMERQMVSAAAATVTIDLPQFLQRNLVFPEVRLQRPVIYLEQNSEGRKNWLLDRQQQDESARIRIDRLRLDQGTLGYDDVAHKTRIRATLSTADTQPGKAELAFTAQGKYKGLTFKAQGHGGPVLGLRDETTPYPLTAELTVGRTVVKATGSITSLLKFTAMDMQVDLRGDNLAQLYPLLGIAFPDTRAYATHGHVVHSEQQWRYEKFSGRIGASDIAGTFQVDTGGKRRALQGDLVSNLFDFADLGPLIGLRPGNLQAARKATPATAHLLPDLPFKAERWDSVDAEVTLHARSIRHVKALPLDNLKTHISLRDAVLILDPLDFGLAGGHLQSMISLDGRQQPIQAHARIKARKIQIARLFPTIKLNQNSIGQINGVLELKGKGDSVRSMLASADGKVGLAVVRGEISQLMLEKAGIHLWEMLQLKISGDKLVKLRCGVADFDVKQGVMQANALVFDTEVTTLFGTGNIDLGQEKLDLTLRQKTKNTSPLALRSPIHIRGSFAHPEVKVDMAQMTARAVGAIALGMLNPLLALIPLIDTGPGSDSDCAQLVRDARVFPR